MVGFFIVQAIGHAHGTVNKEKMTQKIFFSKVITFWAYARPIWSSENEVGVKRRMKKKMNAYWP